MAKSFSFNLLPGRTKEEIEQEEKKSSSLLYAAVMLFFVTFLWLGLRLFHLGVIETQIDSIERDSIQIENQINEYTRVRAQNGELVVKTRILSEVIDKHVDPDLFFEIVDRRIRQSTPNVEILNYGRTPSGNFQFVAVTDGTEDVSKLLKEFKLQDANVADVNLLSLNFNDTEKNYSFTIDLELTTQETSENESE